MWWDVWWDCHLVDAGNITRREWPAGGSYAEQENIVVEVFSIITYEALADMERRRKHGKR